MSQTVACLWMLFFNQSLLKNFQSKLAEKISIMIRLKNKNQSPVDPDQFFNRDQDRDENFKIKACSKIFNQSLLEKIQSRFDDEKLTTSE
nr:hypothetical protein [uncultured Methanoregula sp.]